MKELDNFFKPPFTIETIDKFHKKVSNVDGDHVMDLEGDSKGYLCKIVKYDKDIQDFIFDMDKTKLQTWFQSHIKLSIISWGIIIKL